MNYKHGARNRHERKQAMINIRHHKYPSRHIETMESSKIQIMAIHHSFVPSIQTQ